MGLHRESPVVAIYAPLFLEQDFRSSFGKSLASIIIIHWLSGRTFRAKRVLPLRLAILCHWPARTKAETGRTGVWRPNAFVYIETLFLKMLAAPSQKQMASLESEAVLVGGL